MKLPQLVNYRKNWPSSLEILEKKVTDFFIEQNITLDQLWFVDIEFIPPERIRNQKKVYIIFFGGFLERLYESGNWPKKEYHFICISHQVKEVLIKLFQFNENSISVIERDDLFKTKCENKKIDFSKPVNIFYAGRISPQKNINYILYLAKQLMDFNQVQIHFFGEYDNNFPKNKGRFLIESFKDELKTIIHDLEITDRVHFYHGLGHVDWLKLVPENAIFVNFSTFVAEDFGVSVAQVQQKGYPMILSAWGGHLDVSAANVLTISKNEIITYNEEFNKDMVINVANKVMQFDFNSETSYVFPSTNLKNEFVSLEQIHKIREIGLIKYGPELSLLGQDRMSLFASTKNGEKFFEKYDSIFGR